MLWPTAIILNQAGDKILHQSVGLLISVRIIRGATIQHEFLLGLFIGMAPLGVLKLSFSGFLSEGVLKTGLQLVSKAKELYPQFQSQLVKI